MGGVPEGQERERSSAGGGLAVLASAARVKPPRVGVGEGDEGRTEAGSSAQTNSGIILNYTQQVQSGARFFF